MFVGLKNQGMGFSDAELYDCKGMEVEVEENSLWELGKSSKTKTHGASEIQVQSEILF